MVIERLAHTKMIKFMVGITIVISLSIFVISVFFQSDPNPREKDKETQEEILKRAQSVEPVYQPQNFLSRKSINAWTQRLDNPEKLWYVYLMSDSGAFIGYHICKTVPLSYGVSLTNPEQLVSEYSNSSQKLPAPGVDGVFYTSTDPSVHYCFDAETDALVTFNTQFVYYDMPLNIGTPELKIIVEN